MAVNASVSTNGAHVPSLADEEELYTQLLRLQDAVLSGKHPQLKLPPAAIEHLQLENAKLALVHPPAATAPQLAANGLINGVAFNANAATNNAQLSLSSSASSKPALPGLPGLRALGAHVPPATPSTSAAPKTTPSGLNPIFLEKSDSLVRAESQLKRQRIERELQSQSEQRKHLRDREGGVDAPSAIDVESILSGSQARETHVTGLRPARAGSRASSFDTNDYYSSQVESDWSSPASRSKGSDRAAGPFTEDFERIEGPKAPSLALNSAPLTKQSSRVTSRSYKSNEQLAHGYDEDEDDEYTPPDAAAFDNVYPDASMHFADDDDDDNSEYEPGEITQESNNPTPNYNAGQQAIHPSPQVPVIRNHLTHIAAPQPNRVSPLAVAKGPSIELELVNGRPEVVTKGQPNQHAMQSRASTASPANGVNGSGKKRQRNKKRKRDAEPPGNQQGRGKRKRDKQAAARSPPSPAYREPRIKDEPISPPPFANVPEVQPYAQQPAQYRPAEIDLVSPRYPPQMAYANEPPRSALRYEYGQPTSPAVVRVASPAAYRPVQRDTQDLRRVASMHYAQRPPSPSQRTYSPAPQRTVSMTYGDPRLTQAHAETEPIRYGEPRGPAEHVQYVRAERSRSPPRAQQYQDPYGRAQSPALMPPPAAPQRTIVVDEYGNRYYAAEPAAPPAPPRASVAPVERRPTIDTGYAASARASVAPVDSRSATEIGYGRAPSRMAYAPAATYEQPDVRMAPPPLPRREQPSVQYVDANGYPVRDYSSRPIEQVRCVEAPTPAYQTRYEQPSPVYEPTRSYSVRPEEPSQMAVPYAARQASVAPVQYTRQEAPAPTRAMSVAPGYESQPRAYTQAPAAPPQVLYVDQYGREVIPSQLRQMPAGDYRYQ